MHRLHVKRASHGVRVNEKGFTLIEMLVVVGILLILSSIAMYLYQRGLAHAKETVCQTNLKALKEAIQFYVSENDALPGTLGELKLEHLEKGYAKAMGNRGWLIKACTLLIKLDVSDHAYAQFLTYENLKKYGVAEKIFHCPADHNGGASYGINTDLEGQSWADVGDDVIVVADCDNYVFDSLDQLSIRHNHRALGMTKASKIVEVDSNYEVVAPENSDEKTEADDDDGGEYVTVCHKPGTPSEQTITIPKSDLPGHLGHGDYVGACGE